MNFQRIIVGLLIVTIAGLAGAFYIDWKLAVQLRTVKAFVEGYVFAEAVAACEKAPSTTPFKWNSGTNTSIDWIEFGQARQIHGGFELYAGRRRRLLRLRPDQEEGRHRIEFPRAGLNRRFRFHAALRTTMVSIVLNELPVQPSLRGATATKRSVFFASPKDNPAKESTANRSAPKEKRAGRLALL